LEGEEPNLERLARSTHPEGVFLGLCAGEGQVRFSLNQNLVEGSSYHLPHSDGSAILVSIRRPKLTELGTGKDQTSDSTLTIFSELSQEIASSLDLETVIRTTMENVGNLVPSDFLEITLLDTSQNLLTRYRYSGKPGTDSYLDSSDEPYQHDDNFTGHIISTRTHVLMPDIEKLDSDHISKGKGQIPIRSYLGMPLTIGEELVGTLELGDILEIIIGQAAVALQNALTHRQEQQRADELAGLVLLAQVGGTQYELDELFNRLIDTITPMLDFAIFGFLIYDEDQSTLVGQIPFQGMPDQFVKLYRANIEEKSPAELTIQEHDVILAEDAATDPIMDKLGLSHLVQAADIRNTTLIPLMVSDRSLGYFQASDKTDGSLINQADLRFLKTITKQAAPIIEHAILQSRTRKQNQRAEAIRRIANLMSTQITVDEVFEYSLQEFIQNLGADVACILLLDENIGGLKLHVGSLVGVPKENADRVLPFPINSENYKDTVTATQHSFMTRDVQHEEVLPPTFHHLSEILPSIRSMINVPLIVREHSKGEIIVGSKKEEHFSNNDLQTVLIIAGQLSGSIEREALHTQTEDSLLRRVEQLSSLSNISRELNTSQDIEYLLQRVHDEAVQRTKALGGRTLLLKSGFPAGDSGSVSISFGNMTRHGLSDLEEEICSNNKPVLVDDFKRSELEPHEEGVRSALLVPITFQNKILGLIHLYAKKPTRFDQTALDDVQALASQAAIAIANTLRYQEQTQRIDNLHLRAKVLTSLVENARSEDPDQSLDDAIEFITQGVQESTAFDEVCVYVYDMKNHTARLAGKPGILSEKPYQWDHVEQILQHKFRLGASYFIPYNEYPEVPTLLPKIKTANDDTIPVSSNAWKPGDILITPITKVDGTPLGLICLGQPNNGKRPDELVAENLDFYATEIALIIESHRDLQALRSTAEDIEEKITRAEEASLNTQKHLSTLLHKDLEQIIAIQRLYDRAHRIQVGLDIAEIVNRKPDRSTVLMALGHEMLTQMNLDVALVAEPSRSGPRLLHTLGTIPTDTLPEALLGRHNPLHHTLLSGEALLVPNLEANLEWKDSPLLNGLDTKGFIALPISTNGNINAAILAISQTILPTFTKEDEQIYYMISNQVAIALQNLNLLTETRRHLREVNLLLEFSRRIGGLDPKQILSNLVESALQVLSSAHAGVVALWDEEKELLVPQVAAGYTDNDLITEITYRSGEALPGEVFVSGDPLRIGEVDFANQYKLSSQNLLRYREATGGRLPVSCMLIPIRTGERSLGVIILDNFNMPLAFSEEDEALITSLTQQTALTIENARLFQASEQRALQLQSLADVATTITSSLETSGLTASLLDQLAELVKFETGTLWIRQGDQLTVRAARGFLDSDERLNLSVAVKESALLSEMVATSLPIVVGDVRNDQRFPAFVEHAYQSWLGVPLITKGTVVGVIALEKVEPNYFTQDHVQTITTFAGQAAVALANARLYEDSIRRAQTLVSRTQRLAQLNKLSTELSSSLDPIHLLNFTTRELSEAVNCSMVSAVLFDDEEVPMLLAENPQISTMLPIMLPESELYNQLRQSLGIFISEDIRRDEILLPLTDFLTERDTRSLLAIPLATSTQFLGIFLIHNNQPYRYKTGEIELARTITNQAAIAIENAHFYAQTEQRAVELSTMLETARVVSSTLELEDVLVLISEQMVKALGVDSGTILRWDKEANRVVTWVEWRKDGRERTDAVNKSQSLEEIPSMGSVLEDGLPIALLASDNHAPPSVRAGMQERGVKSMLLLPLAVGDRMIGLVELDEEKEERIYTPSEIILGQALADQAAVAIEHAQLFDETRRFTEELELRVQERTAELAIEHQHTRMLLNISTELSSSLDLDRVINQSLEMLNKTTMADQSSLILYRGNLPNLFYFSGVGYTDSLPTGGRQATIKPGEGLAGWVMDNREPVIITDLNEDDRWIKYKGEEPKHRSAIAAPLVVGEDALGSLMLFHREINHFTNDQIPIVRAAANQFAVAVNNGELYRLIREQAEDLGNMLRTQQVEASRSTAMLEGVADGVLVTNSDGAVTLFNASAEQILQLNREQVVGKSLDDFLGLFGSAFQLWMEAIQTWSQEDIKRERDDMFAERIHLEDGRVISVNAAPVSMQLEYLGTVSIFRDITLQVEVDRLKSDFVGSVSHELRTPMTPIKGYVELLLMGGAGELTDLQVQFLETIQSNANRLGVLVDDLLEVSSIEVGRLSLSYQPIEIGDVAEEVITDIKHKSHEDNKSLTIEMHIETGIPPVHGDLERVRKIFRNLVDNAYRYTLENGHILIRAHQADMEVQVDIQDDGIGINPEDHERVFERFYRGEHHLVMATYGTGLGLPIVRELVEMHSGRIWLDSSGVPGEGSTFSFTLPVYVPEKDIKGSES
jgi:PAS domain S-box-containing protein